MLDPKINVTEIKHIVKTYRGELLHSKLIGHRIGDAPEELALLPKNISKAHVKYMNKCRKAHNEIMQQLSRGY